MCAYDHLAHFWLFSLFNKVIYLHTTQEEIACLYSIRSSILSMPGQHQKDKTRLQLIFPEYSCCIAWAMAQHLPCMFPAFQKAGRHAATVMAPWILAYKRPESCIYYGNYVIIAKSLGIWSHLQSSGFSSWRLWTSGSKSLGQPQLMSLSHRDTDLPVLFVWQVPVITFNKAM